MYVVIQLVSQELGVSQFDSYECCYSYMCSVYKNISDHE